MEAQNYGNHRKWVPLYHFIAAALVLVFFGASIWRLIKQPSLGQTINLGMAAGLVLVFFYARATALVVQDRVIRLEERLRLRELAGADLTSRIDEFTTDQLIGLRFATDEELPGLARKVIDESITGRDAIKKMVQNWRPDHARA
ncbi:MAG: DUF6526 family protein [Gemmatimonadota bacterium]